MSTDDEDAHYGIGDPHVLMEPEQVAGPSDESQLTKQYGKGFSMLKKMGFKTGSGLGPSGEGIVAPIEINLRKRGEGLTEEELQVEPEAREEAVPKPIRIETAEDRKRYALHAKIAFLEDEKKRIEYEIFSLQSTTDSEDRTCHQETIDEILKDLIGSGILAGTASVKSLHVLTRYMSTLRDKYDMNSLWYELDVESVITSAVSTILQRCLDGEILEDLIPIIRELVIDDDGFDSIVEYMITPRIPSTIHTFEIFQLHVSSRYYESFFSRFILPEIVKILNGDLIDVDSVDEGIRPIISDGWIALVPPSLMAEFLRNHITPILCSRTTDPYAICIWKPYYSEHAWSELVVYFSGQILSSLRNLDPVSHHDAKALVQVAISWQVVVPSVLIGFLLVESGFMMRWSDYVRSMRNKEDLRDWCLLLAPVAYHSPARKFLLDALAGSTSVVPSRRPPSGPPRGFFSKQPSNTDREIGLSDSAIGKLTFGDVVREECETRNIPLAPKLGIREAGCQVYRLGSKTVYWKEDALFEKKPDSNDWIEISLDSIIS